MVFKMSVDFCPEILVVTVWFTNDIRNSVQTINMYVLILVFVVSVVSRSQDYEVSRSPQHW